VALGIYLPLSLTTATMVGGLVRAYVNRKTGVEAEQERGVLFASGLIGGDACIGILIALFTILGVIPADAPGWLPSWVSLGTFVLLGFGCAAAVLKKGRSPS